MREVKARERIEFAGIDAATYNGRLRHWQETVQGTKLSKPAVQVAALLAPYVSREFGYAFVTDETLAGVIGKQRTDTKLESHIRRVKRGMTALYMDGLIDRFTRPKYDKNREVEGSERRIWLTVPVVSEVRGQHSRSEGTLSPEVRRHIAENKTKGLPNEHRQLGQKRPGSEGTTSRSEGTTSVPQYVTQIPIDIEAKGNTHTRALNFHPGDHRSDADFLAAFDLAFIDATHRRTVAADVERVVQIAFDAATDSSDTFMPFDWQSVCRLDSGGAKDWFVHRASKMLRQA